jgi:tetratricopeptide (TPR) repeat protein
MLSRSQVLVLAAAGVVGVGLWLQPIGILRNAGKAGAPAATANRDGAVGKAAGAPASTVKSGAVAHDHDGDGAPDHDASADHGPEGATAEAPHRTLSASDQVAIAKLRAAFRSEPRPANRAGRAAAVADKFRQLQQFDSAGFYYEQAAAARPGEKYLQLAADQYFEAFGFATTPERGELLSKKAQDLYQQVLKATPTNLRAKTNLAMTYVASPQPMQGIFLLREVLAADPTNELALYNIGLLSLQSGQHDKAVSRFEELVKAHPKNLNGHFYLGVALANTKQPSAARAAFQRLMTLSPDPQLRASVEQELAKLPK